MKKSIFFISFVLAVCFNQAVNAIPNPWVDCETDFSCGAEKAGFSFPLKVKNYSVRAMEDLFEITFPLDKKRTVTVRKSLKYEGDNSGVYTEYPVNKSITLNDVIFNVRGKKNKFYVVNFASESGYYSIYCKEGMKIGDINHLYKLIQNAETKRKN